MISAPSNTVRVWIAGDYSDACRAVKEFCQRGACWTVTSTEFIYTMGAESGIVASRINYPRFPASEAYLFDEGIALARFLRQRLFQKTACVETPLKTVWLCEPDE